MSKSSRGFNGWYNRKYYESKESALYSTPSCRYQCSCGHTVYIPAYMDKKLCNYCNNFVFRSKKDEFKYKLNEQMMRGKKHD